MSEKTTQELFQERLDRVNKAIALEPTDRVPLAPFFSSWIQRSHGSSYKDIYYDFNKAGDATLQFFKDHPMMDVGYTPLFASGIANELAGSCMIDWPGRPGGKVNIFSSHQVIEKEFMTQEEYPELLNDYTGFMLRKYIPRAYPNLSAFADINLRPTVVLNTSLLAPLTNPAMLNAFDILGKISAADAEQAAASDRVNQGLAELGFPPMMTGIAEAPYDILGDYFRGTMGIFEDLVDEDMAEYVEAACNMFADQQIANLMVYKYLPLPVKRIFFPLHKAMDGFMNEEQFERFYWKPLKKVMMALIDIGVTPYIYTEGPYNSRLEMLADVPKGKVLYHFEKVNMKEAKRILGGTACICGNLPVSQIEFGKKETVINMTRQLLEDCMPGGGYIFDFDGSLENAKPENVDAMFETLEKYGKY